MTTQADQDAFDHDEQMFGPQVTPAELLSQARDVAERIIREAVSMLPEYNHGDHGEVCAARDLKVVSGALEQWCDYSPEDNMARTNGWDDMGDIDGPEWLQCATCGGAWSTPADIDWA